MGATAVAAPAAPDGSSELRQGLQQGVLIAVSLLALALPPASPPRFSARPVAPAAVPASVVPAAPASVARRLDFGSEKPSAAARRLAEWVVAGGDNGNHPFAIVDKHDARAFLFEPGGRLIIGTPVLLGYAHGDDSVPGIGLRPIAQVRPSERTTPAGRFVAQPGHNTLGNEVVWVDYDNAVSMHRVRPTDPRERRLQRLATPSPRDNRISYGCINVPGDVFDRHFWPVFGAGPSVIYVMPEAKPLAAVFPALAAPPLPGTVARL